MAGFELPSDDHRWSAAWLSVSEAAALLRVSRQQFHRMSARNLLQSEKRGSIVLYRRQGVERLALEFQAATTRRVSIG